jgi:hypothetical protein
MAIESRSFNRVTPNTPSQIIYEDLGYGGNNQDQITIQTDALSAFRLTINDDAWTNGGDYAAAFLITVTGENTAPRSFAYVDFTSFNFQAAARELADYYSGLGYTVYDDDTAFDAIVYTDPGEQFTVTISGSLHDNPEQFRGGSAHAVSYTAQVSEPVADQGGLFYGTDFRDRVAFSDVGDFFDARGNLDVITFQNGAGNYQVSVLGNNKAVVNGIELVNTERLEFDDFTLALDLAGTAGQVYRLYQAAFDREPDFNGLSNNVEFVDDGMSMRTLAQHFAASPEFQSLYGQNASNATFINAVYDNVLDRLPDAGGYQYWNTQLSNGMSRGEVLLRFSDSPENVALVAPQIEDGIWLA